MMRIKLVLLVCLFEFCLFVLRPIHTDSCTTFLSAKLVQHCIDTEVMILWGTILQPVLASIYQIKAYLTG